MKNIACKTMVVLLSVSSMQVVMAQKGEKRKSPKPVNLVVFIADDLGAEDIGPYGNRVVRTPHLDKLAGESLLFSRAFACSPTSSPSRASIHTGMFPFRNGAHANHTGISEGVRTLPVYMQKMGYRSAIAGKYHIGPIPAYPFEMIRATNVPEPGYEKKGVLWTDLKLDPVDQWLSEASSGKAPFLLVVNDHSPHVVWPEKPEYVASDVDIPPRHIDTDITRHTRARYYTDITKMDGNVGKLLESLEKYGLAENTVFIFTCDQGPQWAFGKWGLYDYGIRVPMLVRWPGHIRGGTETHAMVSLADLLPTAMEIAGGTAPGAPGEIDGISFLPVLTGEKEMIRDCVFASHTGDGTMNMSPMRMIRTTRYKYILNIAPEILYTTHMDKVGEPYWQSWKEASFKNEHAASVLWRYHNRPAEELYDILSDPGEQRNLAGEKQYLDTLEGFREMMAQWRQQQGDTETGPFVVPPRQGKEPVAPYIF